MCFLYIFHRRNHLEHALDGHFCYKNKLPAQGNDLPCADCVRTHCRNPYTPRFCAFEHRFLPFPNLTPNPPSALTYVSLVVEVLEGGMGMAPAGVPIASLVVEGMGRGMGVAPGVMPFASLVVEVMGRGMGMAPGVMP